MQATAERSALIERLKGALDALKRGDETAWRTWPMMQGLSRLARDLGQALGELPTIPSEAGELDDACSRLDHVVAMTEQDRPATALWTLPRKAARWPTSCAPAA